MGRRQREESAAQSKRDKATAAAAKKAEAARLAQQAQESKEAAENAQFAEDEAAAAAEEEFEAAARAAEAEKAKPEQTEDGLGEWEKVEDPAAAPTALAAQAAAPTSSFLGSLFSLCWGSLPTPGTTTQTVQVLPVPVNYGSAAETATPAAAETPAPNNVVDEEVDEAVVVTHADATAGNSSDSAQHENFDPTTTTLLLHSALLGAEHSVSDM